MVKLINKLLSICFDQVLFFTGVDTDWLDLVLNKSSSAAAVKYNGILIEKLLSIIHTSSQPSKSHDTAKSAAITDDYHTF